MKLGEIIQRVQSLYSSGVESYDSRLTPLHIYSKIMSARAAYISSGVVDNVDALVQETCIRLSRVEQCCALPKSVSVVAGDIPDMIHLKGVYTVDNKRLMAVPQDQIEYINTSLTKKPMYYVANGKIILINNDILRYVKVVGIPYDVVEMFDYCRRTYGLCYNTCDKCMSAYDIDVPVTDAMVEYIVQSAANELIRIFATVKEDKQQDASDDQSLVQQPTTNQQKQ